jgi:hypothetical protein
MPETPQAFYDRVSSAAAAAPDGRLAVSAEVAESDIFPFEIDGLRVKPFEAPVVPEPPRNGDPGGSPCGRCAVGDKGAIWSNERWMLVPPESMNTLPFTALLMPREHLDLGELDAVHAGEMGPLIVEVERAVKSLGDIGRVHVMVVGDGARHLHVWFFGRPLGQLQLRGSSLIDWSDLLPPVPPEVLAADQRAVAEALVSSYGGSAH